MSRHAMKTVTELEPSRGSALEQDFPIVEISQIAEKESWRKEINRPIYHIHKWWAKRLGSVFRAINLAALSESDVSIWSEFYETHNFSGKVVLDPFMGSGTTLGEALKLGAKAIGCDINPVSTFAVKQALTRVAEEDLHRIFAKLEASIAQEIRRYYQTIDHETGNPIPVLYFFWVKIVVTPEGEEIPLFNRYVFSKDAYPKKKPRAQIICPSCWEISEDRYDAAKLTCSSCKHSFNPQQGPARGQFVTSKTGERHRIKELVQNSQQPPSHRLYAMLALRENGEKIYLAPRDHDLQLFDEAASRLEQEELPLPTLAVRPGHNTDQARGYNYNEWRQFFNDRQLLCLGLLLRAIMRIDDQHVREQFLCLFSSTLEFNNLFCSFKGEGTGAVRHMFSNHILKPERTPLENSVWGYNKSSGAFSSLFRSRLLRAKQYLDDPFDLALEIDLLGAKGRSHKITASNPLDVAAVSSWDELAETDQAAMILNGDSSDLPVPDKSIDAVITDPPYFDFVHYSELSDFFFAWLSPVIKEQYPWFSRPDSSHDGEVQHKDPSVFAQQLSLVFSESWRVLKDQGTLAFSFHHSREEGWVAIYNAILRAGFEVVAAHPLHAELRAASPKSAAKNPISLDAILVCRKRGQVLADFQGVDSVIENTEKLTARLSQGGISASDADQFVVAASQALIGAATHGLSLEDCQARLLQLRALLSGLSPMSLS